MNFDIDIHVNIMINIQMNICMKRRRGDQHLKTLCQGLSRAGLNHQPISVSIYKVWTNQKSDILALSLSKSDSLASFIFDSQPGDYYKY